MGKKFVIYLKDSQKAITITDPTENRSIHELSKPIGHMISNIDLSHFETDTDCLILKSDSIVGILIEELNKGKSRVNDLNLDDLQIDIPDAIPQEEEVSLPAELKDDDLSEDIASILNGIEDEDVELQSLDTIISEDEKKEIDLSAYAPPMPQRTPNPIQEVAISELPDHMIAIPEESGEATEDVGSDLLSGMGVVQNEPAESNGQPDPKHIPTVGEKPKIDNVKKAKTVINAASQHKNVVSVTPIRIPK